MNPPALILQVRFKSRLPFDEVMRIVEERAPEFEALRGLQQKYYLEDAASGEVCGLYLWESAEAMAEYQASELKATIAEAYQAEGQPRIEVYHVHKLLRPSVD